LSIFGEPAHEIRMSTLSFIEIQSVFARKVRSGVINQDEAVVQRAFNEAADLIRRYSFTHPLRTLEGLIVLNPELP
jgi:hypothetical protein